VRTGIKIAMEMIMEQVKSFHMSEFEVVENIRINCGSLCICFCLRFTSANSLKGGCQDGLDQSQDS